MEHATPHATTSQPASPQRRTFFRLFTGALGAVGAALAGVPIVGYLFGARSQRVIWVKLGAVGDFPENETREITFDNPLRQPWDGITSQTGVFVRNLGSDDDSQPQFLVLAVNCAHLGCPVSWFPQSGLFLCPCHGGVYYSNGEHASGPPPRGLFHCQWRIAEGALEIQAPHYPTLHDTLKDTA